MRKAFTFIFMLFLLFSGRSQETPTSERNTDKEIGDVPFAVIQEAPVFPGCEKSGSNSAKKKCMSDMVKNFVHSKLNAELGSELGLSGVNRVYVRFMIDKSGTIVDIQTRGPHPVLEKETERAIGLLPKITPGMQRGKPIDVLYSIAIIFEVKDDEKSDDSTIEKPNKRR